MNTKDHLRPFVERGARLLDDRAPGWAHEVNVRELQMGRCDKCILGQVEGFRYELGVNNEPSIYDQKLDALGISDKEYGFDVPILPRPMTNSVQGAYEALGQLWREEINKRIGTQ